jgi:hypothetical protein
VICDVTLPRELCVPRALSNKLRLAHWFLPLGAAICRGHVGVWPSIARVAAGALGFLIFSHASDGPDLYGASSFFETIPSRPSLHAAASNLSCRRIFRNAALRSTYGRRSSPLSISRSKAQAEALASYTRLCRASKTAIPSESSQTTSASTIAEPSMRPASRTIRG